MVKVFVGVLVGVLVNVSVAVFFGVSVEVGVFVSVGVLVGVIVRVSVGTRVAVLVSVSVGVFFGGRVTVEVGVSVISWRLGRRYREGLSRNTSRRFGIRLRWCIFRCMGWCRSMGRRRCPGRRPGICISRSLGWRLSIRHRMGVSGRLVAVNVLVGAVEQFKYFCIKLFPVSATKRFP